MHLPLSALTHVLSIRTGGESWLPGPCTSVGLQCGSIRTLVPRVHVWCRVGKRAWRIETIARGPARRERCWGAVGYVLKDGQVSPRQHHRRLALASTRLSGASSDVVACLVCWSHAHPGRHSWLRCAPCRKPRKLVSGEQRLNIARPSGWQNMGCRLRGEVQRAGLGGTAVPVRCRLG